MSGRISARAVILLLLGALLLVGFQQLGAFMHRMQLQALAEDEVYPEPAGSRYGDRP